MTLVIWTRMIRPNSETDGSQWTNAMRLPISSAADDNGEDRRAKRRVISCSRRPAVTEILEMKSAVPT